MDESNDCVSAKVRDKETRFHVGFGGRERRLRRHTERTVTVRTGAPLCLFSFSELANGYLAERIERFGSRLISIASSVAPAINFLPFPPNQRYLSFVFSSCRPTADLIFAKYFNRIAAEQPRHVVYFSRLLDFDRFAGKINERIRASVLHRLLYLHLANNDRSVGFPISVFFRGNSSDRE